MSRIIKYIPKDCYKTVYDVDFISLYAQGKKFILFDLDNTLAPYDDEVMSDQVFEFLENLKKIGFKVAIVSNNNSKRIDKYLNGYDLPFASRAFKPHKRGYKKIEEKLAFSDKGEVLAVGDQILTDVCGANSYGCDVILVKTIKRSNEKWYTKINRKRIKFILKKIRKINEEMYLKLKEMEEVDNG